MFFDAAAPAWLRTAVEELADGNFTPIWLSEPWNISLIRDAVQSISNTPWLITTRLDSDDLVAPEFLTTIQGQFARQSLIYINLLRGLQVDSRGRLFGYDYPSNPFISLIEQRTAVEPRTVFTSFKHSASNRVASVIEVVADPLWIQVIHPHNLSNSVRGLSARRRELAPVLEAAATAVVRTPVRSAGFISSVGQLVKLWVESPAHLRTYVEARRILRRNRKMTRLEPRAD